MIPSLIYVERYLNEGTRTYSRYADYTEAREDYRPDSIHPSFACPVFEVPRLEMNVYTAYPPPRLAEAYLGEETVPFCIHPQILAENPDDPYVQQTRSIGLQQQSVIVSPSSSTRTLFVKETDIPHALKLHFPFRISRYNRMMTDEVVAQAISVSREIEEGIRFLDDRFAFLREVIGVSHKDLQAPSFGLKNWGYLVRDMRPFPATDESGSLVPGFALYGQDFFHPEKTPLIFDLIGDEDPLSFILESIMLPIIRHWVACFRHFGYLLEPHGQNILLEVDGHARVNRIIHRDLNVAIDTRRRRDIGLFDDGTNDYNRMETNEFNSITYDMFMGGHFFDRIVAALQEKHPTINVEDFRRPCRDEFSRIFPEHGEYLPKNVQYFSEKRDQAGKPLYSVTGQAPVWRPSV